jgi:hypothetical protein
MASRARRWRLERSAPLDTPLEGRIRLRLPALEARLAEVREEIPRGLRRRRNSGSGLASLLDQQKSRQLGQEPVGVVGLLATVSKEPHIPEV